jgi:hypothetical protein
MVLEAGSTYFEGLLTTGEEIAGRSSQDEAVVVIVLTKDEAVHKNKRRKVEDPPQVIDLTCNNEQDAAASEAVLEFLYNNTLPASPSISALCKVRQITVTTSFRYCSQILPQVFSS